MKLKKIIFIFIGIILISGCDKVSSNTPTGAIETFFGKYQKNDDVVLRQLDLLLDTKSDYSDDDKKEYKALMIKQYQNLSYKITDERQEGDTAIVETEVEVYDYRTSISKSQEYYYSHKDEFKDESIISYQIRKMKDVNDRTIYSITFNLHKDDKDNWKIDNVSDEDRKKIHGLY